jgi:LytS/YehU family sensor histidine kinase
MEPEKIAENHVVKMPQDNKKDYIIKKEDLANICMYLTEKTHVFALWISGLSWGRFILFLFVTTLISNALQSLLISHRGDNWIDGLTGLFLVISFAMKIFFNSKIRSEIKIKEAQYLAEKEMLQRQLVEAKIQVMQAQIEPHFLFNTLSSLSYLIENDTAKANQMLMSLVTYLRYSLPQIRENQAFNTLGKEIDNIRAYLNIMEIRMGDRLQVTYDIPDLFKDVKFPSMMLQPIVENAIKYGIEESMNGGVIKITANYVGNMLEVSVCDTGVGLNGHKISGGNGMALNNIKSRLDMLYDKKANFIISNNEPTGVIVKIQIPVL